MSKPEPTKLRWFQFSLRTLLLFVTLCAIPCSWIAVRMRAEEKRLAERKAELERQHKLAQPIEDLGGCVYFRPQCVPDGDYVILCDPRVTDAALKQIRWWADIRKLELDDSQITDAGLPCLAELTQLRWLDISRTTVSDAGLKHLIAKATPSIGTSGNQTHGHWPRTSQGAKPTPKVVPLRHTSHGRRARVP